MPLTHHTKQKLLEGTFDVLNDTIRVLLLDNSTSYTFDASAHEFVNDVADGGTTGTEMSGTNYSRKTLSNPTTTQDDTDGEGVFDADDVTWSSLDAGTIQTIVVYKQVGGDDTTPGDDPILVVLDDAHVADLTLQTGGSDVTIQWDAEGIVNIT